MTMKYLTLIFGCLLVCLSGKAQDQERILKDRKYELGVNITRVLSNLVGNEVEEAVFPLTLKVRGSKHYWRFSVDPTLENINNLSLNARVTDITSRIGVEKRAYLGDRWRFLYGIDLYGFYRKDASTNTSPIDVLRFTVTDTGLGLAPVFGFQFLLTDRIALELETNYLFSYIRQKSTLAHEVATNLDTETSSNSFSVTKPDPKFLYIIVRF